MKKKRTLETLKSLFKKNCVLDMDQLRKAIKTKSPVTVFRYLRELGSLTSYTHRGKYYTLPEIAQFEKNGFWHFENIGFSTHGTLLDTLIHIITISEAGMTNSELENLCRTKVQNSLQCLLKLNKITKASQERPCLYVNPDPKISEQQIKRREEITRRKQLPDWIVMEILVETIRSFPMQPQVDDVVKRLAKKGALITLEQVRQVFEEHDLEKKTLD